MLQHDMLQRSRLHESLSVCLSVCLSVFLSVCLSVCYISRVCVFACSICIRVHLYNRYDYVHRITPRAISGQRIFVLQYITSVYSNMAVCGMR